MGFLKLFGLIIGLAVVLRFIPFDYIESKVGEPATMVLYHWVIPIVYLVGVFWLGLALGLIH